MKKLLFSLIATALVLVSCGGVDPVAFNDAIVKANTTITALGETYQNDITKSIESSDFSAIAAQTDSALAKINTEIDIVKSLEVPKGGDGFKEAAVKTYESLRDVVETGRKLSTLNTDSTEEAANSIMKEYDEKSSIYSKQFDELAKAQMDFAKEANYKVQ